MSDKSGKSPAPQPPSRSASALKVEQHSRPPGRPPSESHSVTTSPREVHNTGLPSASQDSPPSSSTSVSPTQISHSKNSKFSSLNEVSRECPQRFIGADSSRPPLSKAGRVALAYVLNPTPGEVLRLGQIQDFFRSGVKHRDPRHRVHRSESSSVS